MPAKRRLLADESRRLSPEEVLSFEEHFSDCFWRADTWDVLGAAHVINNGCGDDGFMDFRAALTPGTGTDVNGDHTPEVLPFPAVAFLRP
jgi:hypothetical protein